MAIALGFDHMSAAVAIGRSPRPTVGAPHLRLATTERIGGLRPTRSAHPRAGRRHISPILASAVQAGATVLVLGATGGVGQIVTAKLIDRGYNVRAATRSAEKAAKLFGNTVEVVVGDTRDPDTLDNLLQGGAPCVPCVRRLFASVIARVSKTNVTLLEQDGPLVDGTSG